MGRMRVYTDGACSGNPGPGGWAWASVDGRSASGAEAQTTNQRMEVQAVLEALRALDGPIEIVSDSTYVVNCFNQDWWKGWIARGWRNTAKKPVANRDLWEPLIELYQQRRSELDFTWVKGHSGDRMNDLVDRLAVEASKAMQASLGLGAVAPLVAEPEPEPAPWPTSAAVWVVGTTDPTPDERAALTSAVDRLDPGHDVLVSGLRRGVELDAAERACRRGIPLAAVLPFADPDRRWSSDDRDRFAKMWTSAAWQVVLDGDPSQPGRAVDARNDWISTQVTGAVVVGDHSLSEQLDRAGIGVVSI